MQEPITRDAEATSKADVPVLDFHEARNVKISTHEHSQLTLIKRRPRCRGESRWLQSLGTSSSVEGQDAQRISTPPTGPP